MTKDQKAVIETMLDQVEHLNTIIGNVHKEFSGNEKVCFELLLLLAWTNQVISQIIKVVQAAKQSW